MLLSEIHPLDRQRVADLWRALTSAPMAEGARDARIIVGVLLRRLHGDDLATMSVIAKLGSLAQAATYDEFPQRALDVIANSTRTPADSPSLSRRVRAVGVAAR